MNACSPGPWRYENAAEWHEVADASGGCVARFRGDFEHTGANARLIAAAPDLFEALGELTRWHVVMEQAINLSEGKGPGAQHLRRTAYDLSLNKALAALAKVEAQS